MEFFWLKNDSSGRLLGKYCSEIPHLRFLWGAVDLNTKTGKAIPVTGRRDP
jgi:hypothetical protein